MPTGTHGCSGQVFRVPSLGAIINPCGHWAFENFRGSNTVYLRIIDEHEFLKPRSDEVNHSLVPIRQTFIACFQAFFSS